MIKKRSKIGIKYIENPRLTFCIQPLLHDQKLKKFKLKISFLVSTYFRQKKLSYMLAKILDSLLDNAPNYLVGSALSKKETPYFLPKFYPV